MAGKGTRGKMTGGGTPSPTTGKIGRMVGSGGKITGAKAKKGGRGILDDGRRDTGFVGRGLPNGNNGGVRSKVV